MAKVEKHNGKIVKIEHLNRQVLLIAVNTDDEFYFLPGQYVMFRISSGKESKGRAYSICNTPSEKGSLEFCINLIKGGFASEFWKKSKKGDELEFRGPFGELKLDEKSKEHWFLASGTGVAPFKSILKSSLGNPEKKKDRFVLIFSARTRKDLFFVKDFLELEKRHSNFKFSPTLTQEKGKRWTGLRGRIQQNLPEAVENKTFYVCGRKETVEDITDKLLSKGVKKERIRTEKYY
jgi:ferredoxin-NADP reductase